MKKLFFIILFIPILASAQLNLPFGVKTLVPAPLNVWEGPYTSIAAANAAVPSAFRRFTFAGAIYVQTVQINGVEYWWKDGNADIDLVAKGGSTSWASITGKLAKNGVYLDGDTLKLGGQLSGATFYNPADSSDYMYIVPETGELGIENPTNDVSILFGGSVNGVIGMSKISNGDLWFYALENSTTVAQSLVIRDNQAAGYNSITSYDPIGLTDSELRIQSSFNVFNSAIQVGSLGGSTINGRFGYNGSNYVGRRSGTNYDFPLTLNGNTANRMPVWQANSILGQTPYTVPTVNGSNGQVLTTNGSGAATWQTPSSGFSDPMTTRGDIIIRNASNTTARLGVGANTYVLTSDGTDVSWAAPSGGGSGLTYAQVKALKFK